MRIERVCLISPSSCGLHRGQRSCAAHKGRTYDRYRSLRRTSSKNALDTRAVPHMSPRNSLRAPGLLPLRRRRILSARGRAKITYRSRTLRWRPTVNVCSGKRMSGRSASGHSRIRCPSRSCDHPRRLFCADLASADRQQSRRRLLRSNETGRVNYPLMA